MKKKEPNIVKFAGSTFITELTPQTMQTLTKNGGIMLRVTLTEDYLFEAGHTNGWDSKTTIDQWFKKANFNLSHAARDGARIGGSRVIQTVQVLAEDGKVKSA